LDKNCEIYSKEVQVNDVNGLINSDDFSRSCDDLYLGVTFLGHMVIYIMAQMTSAPHARTGA